MLVLQRIPVWLTLTQWFVVVFPFAVFAHAMWEAEIAASPLVKDPTIGTVRPEAGSSICGAPPAAKVMQAASPKIFGTRANSLLQLSKLPTPSSIAKQPVLEEDDEEEEVAREKRPGALQPAVNVNPAAGAAADAQLETSFCDWEKRQLEKLNKSGSMRDKWFNASLRPSRRSKAVVPLPKAELQPQRRLKVLVPRPEREPEPKRPAELEQSFAGEPSDDDDDLHNLWGEMTVCRRRSATVLAAVVGFGLLQTGLRTCVLLAI